MLSAIRILVFVTLWTLGCTLSALGDLLGYACLLVASVQFLTVSNANVALLPAARLPSWFAAAYLVVFSSLIALAFLSVSGLSASWLQAGHFAQLTFWALAWCAGIAVVLRQLWAKRRVPDGA